MLYAHICPLSSLKIANQYNDMHLLLYHWAQVSPEYVKYMRRSKVYKMLDNSQFELRKEIDYDDLIRYAIKMGVDEVIAPDIMYNYKRTKQLIEEFIPKVPKRMKIQGVVCGKNLKELRACYDWLCDNERIDVVAFSKHGCTVGVNRKNPQIHFERRQFLMNAVLPTYKPIHMLGVNAFRDFLTPKVRSIDGKFLAKVANSYQKITLATNINNVKFRVLLGLFERIKNEK